MPSSAAAMSRLSSPASAPWGAPNPRYDEAGVVFVYTASPTTRNAGTRYGPKHRLTHFVRTSGLLSA